MVSANIKYVSTVPGLGKLVSILLGILAIGLGGHAYDRSIYNLYYRLTDSPEFVNSRAPNLNGEIFFLGVTGIALTSSVICLLCHIFNEGLGRAKIFMSIDIGIHVASAFFQLLAATTIIISLRNISYFCRDYHEELNLPIPTDYQLKGGKISAGVFAILNFFVLGFVSAVELLQMNEDRVIRTIY
jgi:hypothetical protein